jgi:hypothetical protein
LAELQDLKDIWNPLGRAEWAVFSHQA